MQQAILVVDDEEDILTALDFSLRRAGYLPRRATTGAEALALIGRGLHVDLVILDLMLPDVSGCQLCQKLKSRPETAGVPVIMLSARGDEVDRVVGFEMGADDYVVKPFSPRELCLRVRAILERGERAAAATFRMGPLALDRLAHRVSVAGDDVHLTALEFRLLAHLVGRRGRVQTRDSLLADVWGIRAEVTTRTVDTHVKRLREKLGVAGAFIETLRGVGYRFSAWPPAASAG